MASTNRFLHLFCVFVRALASPSHPIVLYLDDLQWINEPTLELLSRLITDEESKEGFAHESLKYVWVNNQVSFWGGRFEKEKT